MRKLKRIISLVLALGVVITTVLAGATGCGSTIELPKRNRDAVVIIGIHKNFSFKSVLEDKVFKDTVASYISSEKAVTFIGDGGDPEVIYKSDAISLSGQSENQKVRKGYQTVRDEIYPTLMSYTPSSDEVDILSAFQLAGKLGDCDIYMYDTFIQTKGMFITNSDFIASDYDNIVSLLRERYELPALSEKVITWAGYEAVCDLQSKMTQEVVYKFRSFWEKVITACGATLVFDSTPVKVIDNDSTLPNVTPVSFDYKPIVIDPITLTETDLGFKPNSAEFANPSAAQAKINAASKELANYEGTIYLVGSTASWGDEKSCLSLSEKRAKAVSKILAQSLPNKLVYIGIGRSKSKLRKEDLNNGRLDESVAKKNRCVWIFTEGTDMYTIALSEGIIK